MENTKVCIVNADNEFVFNGLMFQISNKNKNYKVINSYRENRDYTNSAEMTTVKVGIEKDTCKILFFNEDDKQMTDVLFVGMVGV